MFINKDTRLLVVSPHPDDDAIGAGGLIGKVKKEGGAVLVVYMGVGDSRQLTTGKTEGSTRLEEVEAAKKFAGIEAKALYVQKDHVCLDTIPQKDMVEKIDDVMEEFKPTIIAIPSFSSYNQDHRATHDACLSALRPTPHGVRHMPLHILEYFEPYFWHTRDLKDPTIFLDLSESYGKGNLLDFKIGLYKCHATQVREEPSPRSVENLTRWAHVYGKEIGVSVAEAYHVLRMVIHS